MQTVLQGTDAGLLHSQTSREDIPVTVRMTRADRSSLDALESTKLTAADGSLVSLREITHTRTTTLEPSIYHKNMKRVVYVTGDVAGAAESPVYAIFKMNEALDRFKLPAGYTLGRYNAVQPESTDRYAMKWDGEWHITIEVFRDLGMAFGMALLLIYVLVVGWFRSFVVPLVIMAPIPLTLVGILPAHALMGAFFTATSMIGFIAGAGIIVRNSIILVDFIELRRRAGNGVGRCRGGCRCGALPPHAADGCCGRGGRQRHPLRPDLPGTGTFADGGRSGVHTALAYGCSSSLLTWWSPELSPKPFELDAKRR